MNRRVIRRTMGENTTISSFFYVIIWTIRAYRRAWKKVISMLNRRKADIKVFPDGETRLFENSFNFRRKGEYSNI
jgi:hypothetical protein